MSSIVPSIQLCEKLRSDKSDLGIPTFEKLHRKSDFSSDRIFEKLHSKSESDRAFEKPNYPLLGDRIAAKRAMAVYLNKTDPDEGEMKNIISRLTSQFVTKGFPPLAPSSKTRSISRSMIDEENKSVDTYVETPINTSILNLMKNTNES